MDKQELLQILNENNRKIIEVINDNNSRIIEEFKSSSNKVEPEVSSSLPQHNDQDQFGQSCNLDLELSPSTDPHKDHPLKCLDSKSQDKHPEEHDTSQERFGPLQRSRQSNLMPGLLPYGIVPPGFFYGS